jgi:NitT/TauT family transport system permease protein
MSTLLDIAPTRVRPRPKLASRFASRAAPVLSVPVVLGLWEAFIRIKGIEPFIFPSPSGIGVALYNGLWGGSFLSAIQVTLVEILAGFVFGAFSGLFLGILMASIPLVHRVMFPWVVALQTIPKVAIAPLMIVWFGFGVESKILIVGLTCLFPVLVNTMAGLQATEINRINLVRALSGTRLQVLRYVLLPSALPYIFAGLNTAMVLAVIGAIVGEFVGARNGIGVRILQANFTLDLASVFALLAVLSAIGIALNSAIRFAERKICYWSGRSS